MRGDPKPTHLHCIHQVGRRERGFSGVPSSSLRQLPQHDVPQNLGHIELPKFPLSSALEWVLASASYKAMCN